MAYFLVDVEASGGPTPFSGKMTEFGAVELKSGDSFHGILYDAEPDPNHPAVSIIAEGAEERDRYSVMNDFNNWVKTFPGRAVFISDNNGYDYQWVAYYFDSVGIENPFGHSSRRISDMFAGTRMANGGSWTHTQEWKKWRVTKHTHNPVDDSMGNREALLKLLENYGQHVQ